MKALVLGHFSTIGDVESLAYVEGVLRDRHIPYDVHAYVPKVNRRLDGSIDRSNLDPAEYTHLIVVCGPFWPELLARRGFVNVCLGWTVKRLRRDVSFWPAAASPFPRLPSAYVAKRTYDEHSRDARV